MEFIFSIETQKVSDLFRFLRMPWIYLVLLLGRPKKWNQKASLRRVLFTLDKQILRVSDICLVVLRPNVGFSTVFKPVNFNLASYYSDNSGLVDFLWSHHNHLNFIKFLNIHITISRSSRTDFLDDYGTNRSEVLLRTCLNRFLASLIIPYKHARYWQMNPFLGLQKP